MKTQQNSSIPRNRNLTPVEAARIKSRNRTRDAIAKASRKANRRAN